MKDNYYGSNKGQNKAEQLEQMVDQALTEIEEMLPVIEKILQKPQVKKIISMYLSLLYSEEVRNIQKDAADIQAQALVKAFAPYLKKPE